MRALKEQLTRELKENILPFWMNEVSDGAEGFVGRIDGRGRAVPDAERGSILYARILWTFSSAWRILRAPEYLETARKAYRYISRHFIDGVFGGVYWSLYPDGRPKDDRKQFYAIAFTIYALAEYYRACGEQESLDLAVELFRSIERHSLDKEYGGYLEACSRNWESVEDMRLSDKDQNDAKTMNTHLHILEAYTGLYRVWKDKALACALRDIACIFPDRIICRNGHLGLFFDEKWKPTSSAVSFGHDIEASWLLCEAADLLEDAPASRIKTAAGRLAEAAMEGFTMEGGMEYEFDPASGRRNPEREWWVQAETVVGCINRFQITTDRLWLERACAQWEFIRRFIICPEGEWYWSALPADGSFSANLEDDRAGFWKCPYHNGRMCLEIIERFR